MAKSFLSGIQIPTLSDLNIDGELTLDAQSGTSGQVLISQGTGNTPAWTSSLTNINGLTSDTAGSTLGIYTGSRTAANTGNLQIQTGTATTSGSSGFLYLDVGSAAVTKGVISIGSSPFALGNGNVNNIYIGNTNNSSTTTIYSTLVSNSIRPSSAGILQPATTSGATGYNLTVAGGDTSYAAGVAAGGALNITGGAATGGTSASTGGAVYITGGDSNLTAGTGGLVQIFGGAGLNQGNINLNARNITLTVAATGTLSLPYNPLLRYHPTDINIGGQISFARATDNTARWDIRAAGSSNTPSLNIVEAGTTQVSIATGGVTTFSGAVKLRAGTATANTAPLYFATGTNLTTPLAGALEYNGTTFFSTPSVSTATTGSTVTGRGRIPAVQTFYVNADSVIATASSTTASGNVLNGKSFWLAANTVYEVEYYLHTKLVVASGGAAATNHNLIVTFPTSAVGLVNIDYQTGLSSQTIQSTTIARQSNIATTTNTIDASKAIGTTTYYRYVLKGTVKTGATAGYFLVQNGVTTSSGTTATLTAMAGSYGKSTILGASGADINVGPLT